MSKMWISGIFFRYLYFRYLYFRYLSGALFSALKSVLEVAFPLKPFDLGSCVFPCYIGFGVLYFPWIGYDNIAFSNPHFLLFRARNSAHADNSVHTLKCYSFWAKQTCNRSQNFISVPTGDSDPGYFRGISCVYLFCGS